ncbi:MAG: hypothetical protein WC242_00220 [Candidatus Paceibacterota bacterium]|jgi:hypothetical protein
MAGGSQFAFAIILGIFSVFSFVGHVLILGIVLAVLAVLMIIRGIRISSVVLSGDHPERRKDEVFTGNVYTDDFDDLRGLYGSGVRFGGVAYTTDGESLAGTRLRPCFRTIESVEAFEKRRATEETEAIMRTLRDGGGHVIIA